MYWPGCMICEVQYRTECEVVRVGLGLLKPVINTPRVHWTKPSNKSSGHTRTFVPLSQAHRKSLSSSPLSWDNLSACFLSGDVRAHRRLVVMYRPDIGELSSSLRKTDRKVDSNWVGC
jgi:hypothetical protein